MLVLGEKVNPSHLYVCQPNQIIQLVEGPPPPARRISSVVESSRSSYPSTSDLASSSSSSSSLSSSESEVEEGRSSYCSSVMAPDESSKEREPVPWMDATYAVRMKRVQEWRNRLPLPATVSTGTFCPGPPVLAWLLRVFADGRR